MSLLPPREGVPFCVKMLPGHPPYRSRCPQPPHAKPFPDEGGPRVSSPINHSTTSRPPSPTRQEESLFISTQDLKDVQVPESFAHLFQDSPPEQGGPAGPGSSFASSSSQAPQGTGARNRSRSKDRGKQQRAQRRWRLKPTVIDITDMDTQLY